MRILSGIQATGTQSHLGTWLGAVRQYVALQDAGEDCFYFVADLHGITAGHDPQHLRDRTRSVVAEMLALGVDPQRATLFVQSHVPAHPELSWVLECHTGFGEASRMTQFKDKAARQGEGSSSVGLFTYPVLQAADILLYQAEAVPVGDDQRQHLELTRDLAVRFNNRYGATFTVPTAFVPEGTARVMDVADPTAKMSKSNPPGGTLGLQDDLAALRKKVRSATTDSGREVLARPDKPGITNLLGIYSGLTGRSVAELEEAYAGKGYGDFKGDLADVVVDFVAGFQERYRPLLEDTDALDEVLARGAARAREVAGTTLALAKERVGFLPAAG